MSLIVNASDGTAFATVCNANFTEIESKLGPVAAAVITNKAMACAATTVDGALATANTLTSRGRAGSYIQVMVNGIQVTVGDGVKTKDCYFSGDGGTTARAIVDIVAGDSCYWMGSVAGYQLATTDTMDWNIS